MTEIIKAQGDDFGNYTVISRDAIKRGITVDFMIFGIGYGAHSNKTWHLNKPECMKEDRRILYSFFNHGDPWRDQADFIIKEFKSVDAHAVALDWEQGKYHFRTDMNIPKQAKHLKWIMKRVRDGIKKEQVGVYANKGDYAYLAHNQDVTNFFLWCADPDNYPDDHPWTDIWWHRAGRPKYDYVFDQYSWKGHAPDYGAINGKLSMDLTQCKYDLAWLDIWLGLESAPTPEPPPIDQDTETGLFIPSISYKSQSDPDANVYVNDCGPTALAMILNAHGLNLTTDEVYKRTDAPANQYVSVSQMRSAAASYGKPFNYFSSWNLDQLKEVVAAGKAPIVLVHYGAWSKLGKTQSSFKGPHFVVVVGFDDDHIYVNDSLWSGSRRSEGEHKRWTNAEFNAAWSSAHLDGNRNNSGIYCTVPLPVEVLGEDTTPEDPPAPPPDPDCSDVRNKTLDEAKAALEDLKI